MSSNWVAVEYCMPEKRQKSTTVNLALIISISIYGMIFLLILSQKV